MGDTVRISKQSSYYSDTGHNPKDTDGKIISIDYVQADNDNGIQVRWDNGQSNTYCTSDLKMRVNGGHHDRGNES